MMKIIYVQPGWANKYHAPGSLNSVSLDIGFDPCLHYGRFVILDEKGAFLTCRQTRKEATRFAEDYETK